MIYLGNHRTRRGATIIAVGALAFGLVATPASAAGVWDGDGPWGPYGWDEANDRFHQPTLATPVPEPAPLGAYDRQDFDGDGVPNISDNCLLVPNADQEPAIRTGDPIGPADMVALADEWKAQHPDARFRTDAELGEACSGYNQNYLRSTQALIKAPNQRKLEIFQFLGESGPMFGGAADPFPAGKPTDYDHFGSLPGTTSPDPTTDERLPRNADGSLADGNMTPSMPMCSGYEQYAGFMRWLAGLDNPAFDPFFNAGSAFYAGIEDQVGCGSDLQRPGWEQAMRHGWAGKRLYTNAEGGRITNRFVASMTEHPLYELFLTQEPFKTFAQQSGLHPYADDTDSPGQSRHGLIFRGESYVDGRDAIMMDWRGFEAAWPLGHGDYVEGVVGNLIYDECRAIQTGVYNCTAVMDPVIGERRHTFQEGYMPWVVKGPPTIDEYIAAVR